MHIIDGNNYANAVVLLSTEELEEAYNEIKRKRRRSYYASSGARGSSLN